MPYTRFVTGKKTTLSKSFTLVILLIFISGITLSGITLSQVLGFKARQEVASTANVLMDILNSARKYTSSQIAPKLQERMTPDEFLPQIVPAYTAGSIFRIMRQEHPMYSEYSYKEAMLNPTNPNDKANEFETKLIERFRRQRNLKTVADFISLPSGSQAFYTAYPIVIKDPNCLQCHSTPERAPQEMIDIYGVNNGFNWQLNQVLGTQVVYVPATIVQQKVVQSLLWILGSIALIFAITMFAANLWLKKHVVTPINQVVQVAEAVSTGDMTAEFKNVSNNEVGVLVEAFTRMKVSLEMAIRRLEQYRVQNRRGNDFNSK